jgi:4-hydroxy-tetrahydrodipicolinate synthase
MEKMLGFLIKSRVNGIFAVGNAGEFYALDREEKRKVLKTTLKITSGQIPVFFGAGTASTAESVYLTRLAEAEGADAVSVITPFLIKPSEEELYQHYLAICEATKLPVLPYNNPSVTGVAISPRLMKRLSAIDNIAGIKDSSGDLSITLEFLQIEKKNFTVLAGRDGLILSTLIHGGSGAISSVASACPEIAVAIYESYAAGDMKGAVEAQMKFARLRQMFGLGTFPTVIKAALHIRGFSAGVPRLPVSPLPRGKYEELEACLNELLSSENGKVLKSC